MFLLIGTAKDIPIIIEAPKNMTVNAGDNTHFVCKVSSKNNSQIVWLKHKDIHPTQLNKSGPIQQFHVKLT